MAKKDYTSYIIGGLVFAAAGGGYYYYRRAKVKKEAAEAEAERKKNEAEQSVQQKNIKTSLVLTPYQRKVTQVQTFLGVAVDGIPGPQTNQALQKRAPVAYKTYGAVSPTNIDFYNALLRGPKNLIM
jgi:hypothetical protein